ncbi:MAG: hypothetical protein CSA33_04485 [Desulfobulbus propionicus]|nr:MAG: hypothetical protein CSA33_04485 [Desulfobulbus propionicus]
MKKVLIVDDDQSFLLSLQDGLSVHENTYRIITATNGIEATRYLQEEEIDLLVTDLEMPEMNGFELIAWVSRNRPSLPVVIMTAFGTSEIESQVAQYGAIRYLEKPLDLATIEKALTDGLEKESKSYIQGIPLAAFLQLLQIEKKSCTLKVNADDRVGYIFFLEGNLIDAEYENYTGEVAASHIVCWENAGIELDTTNYKKDGPIDITLEALLLRAHYQKDEGAQGRDNTTRLGEADGSLPDSRQEKSSTDDDGIDWELFSKKMRAHTAVADFLLFDQRGKVDLPGADNMDVDEFDPAIFLHFLVLLQERCDLGRCREIRFTTSRRITYLLYVVNNYTIVVILKKGKSFQFVEPYIKTIISPLLSYG